MIDSAWGGAAANGTFTPDECWALRLGQPHLSHDGARCVHCPPGPPWLCVPMTALGELTGCLTVGGCAVLDEETRRHVTRVGEHLALALANLRLRERLHEQSIRDPLTGLFNRRYTEETLVRELSRSSRTSEPVSVVMIDIDHFKRFNDTFGHEAGDAVLTEVARVLQKQTRGSDVASRMGGEELVVVLPGASLVDAERRAEHLRVSIAALNLHHRGQSLGHLTISIGVATTETDGVAADLIHAADQAMYRAKREGRDCVRVAGEPRETRDIREPPRTFGSAVNVSMVAA